MAVMESSLYKGVMDQEQRRDPCMLKAVTPETPAHLSVGLCIFKVELPTIQITLLEVQSLSRVQMVSQLGALVVE